MVVMIVMIMSMRMRMVTMVMKFGLKLTDSKLIVG